MARPEKIAEVTAIADHLKTAQAVVLADFTGLSVAQMTEFRNQCREKGIVCRVVKNRLAKIAADQAEVTVLNEHLKGPTALIMGSESQVEPAKIVVEFAKSNEALEVKGGLVGVDFLTPVQVVALSKTPSLDELYAKMMGSINSPASGIVGTVNGVMAALTRAVDAVAKQKAS
jgi:large subunit ribosomal protein L10